MVKSVVRGLDLTKGGFFYIKTTGGVKWSKMVKQLIGEYSHKVDLKKRVFIPADFRVSKKWVVTAGLEGCLFLFPEKEWEKIRDKIQNLPLTKNDARSFLRVLLSKAKYLISDNQGRILLPDKLVDYSNISRVCVIIGMISRIELWNPDKWKRYLQMSEEKYSELAEGIAELEL